MLMVGGWTDIFKKAKTCGFELTVCQKREDLKGEDLETCDQIVTSAMDSPGLISLVRSLHDNYGAFDSVLSFQEHGVMNAALIRDELQIFGNPTRPVLLTRNKARMRNHMREAGIPSIPFVSTRSAQVAADFGAANGWPIVVKPILGSGSNQVHKVECPDRLEQIFGEVWHSYPETEVLAEAFMEGPEVSVEAVTWAGKHQVITITDKLTTGAPYFVEMGHTMPTRLAPKAQAAIRDMTVSFLDSIGHAYGPSHTEIIVTKSGPLIVESHTRTGGDRIFEMVELSTGFDMFTATLQGFAGAFPTVGPFPAHKGVAIRYFNIEPGTVTGFDGVAQAEKVPGVRRVESKVKIGMKVGPIRKSDDRHGYILATAETAAEAAASAETAMAQLIIAVEPQEQRN
jgi:biotin carboxylase